MSAAQSRDDLRDDLQDALHELLEASEAPDAEILEEILKRYPEHASELTDFAVEWALQDLLPEAAEEASEASAVPAAMARFRARLDELDGPRRPALADPFADRSPAELKTLAANLGLDKILVAKLRDRKILADTVPPALRDGLASELGVPVEVVAAHLAAPARIPLGASFKAERAPEAGPKESFEQALRRSSLDDDRQRSWLSRDA